MDADEKFFSRRTTKTIVISSIILLITIVCAFIFFVYVGVFHLIGIEYTSRTALLLFFFLILILSGISNFLTLFFKVLLQPLLELMPKWMDFSLISFIEISIDWLALHTADDWMESVTISNKGELLIILAFFILGKIWPDDKKKNK